MRIFEYAQNILKIAPTPIQRLKLLFLVFFFYEFRVEFRVMFRAGAAVRRFFSLSQCVNENWAMTSR